MGLFNWTSSRDIEDFSELQNVKKVLNWMLNYDEKIREHKKIIDGNSFYDDMLAKQIFNDVKEFNSKKKLAKQINNIWSKYKKESLKYFKKETEDEDIQKSEFMNNIKMLPIAGLEVRMRVLGWIYYKKYNEQFDIKENL